MSVHGLDRGGFLHVIDFGPNERELTGVLRTFLPSSDPLPRVDTTSLA